jgi:hypothetical protein
MVPLACIYSATIQPKEELLQTIMLMIARAISQHRQVVTIQVLLPLNPLYMFALTRQTSRRWNSLPKYSVLDEPLTMFRTGCIKLARNPFGALDYSKDKQSLHLSIFWISATTYLLKC